MGKVKCMFGCGDYGMGACPPNVPLVEECEKFFKEYSKGIIIRISKLLIKIHILYPGQKK
jgi:predicted metal-binding protein